MRKTGNQARPLVERVRNSVFPVAMGTALFLTYPSMVSYQDVASLSNGARDIPSSSRWLASVSKMPGVSTASASVSGAIDTMIVGSIRETPAPKGPKGEVTLAPKVERTPQTVNRSLKGDRIISTSPVRPPQGFTAGSVLELSSLFGPLDADNRFEKSFVKAKKVEEALQVASAFHLKKPRYKGPKVSKDLPVMVASLVRESAPNILAYAEEPEYERSPFAAVLEDSTPLNIIPRLGKGDHKWADDPLPKASYSKKQQTCLTAGIYFEARGEPVKGQAAVSQVILNRVKNPTYPNSICGVVYQNKHWRNRCQFSFACDRIKDRINDKKRWKTANYVARETTEGRIWLKEVGSSTHYHATYVSPKWARSMKKVGRIGLHIFYRTYGGGWS